jgi:hypothetical protein
MLIGKPYTKCPKCGKDTFGRLSVSGNTYTKRCGECIYTQDFVLIPVEKKAIYLDQFVISNLMMSINKKLNKDVDEWYLKLFNKLEYAVKGQIIICPYSDIHESESTPFHFQDMKRMYEHFAHGIKLSGKHSIKMSQTFTCFKAWKDGKDPEYDLSIDSILQGKKNEWQDTIIITIDKTVDEVEIIKYKEYLDGVYEGLLEYVDKWRARKESYNTFYTEESNATGVGIVQTHSEYMTTYAMRYLGKNKKMDINDYLELGFMQPVDSFIYLQLEKQTGEEDVKKSAQILDDFLFSETFKNMPYNQISSSLWANIRHQYSIGQRVKPVTRGIFNDVDMLALYLPYLDTMIIDKDMHNVVKYNESRSIMEKYFNKVFSLVNKDEFFEYIDSLIKNTPAHHFKTLEFVYGEDWFKPYTTMYENPFKKDDEKS